MFFFQLFTVLLSLFSEISPFINNILHTYKLSFLILEADQFVISAQENLKQCLAISFQILKEKVIFLTITEKIPSNMFLC